MSEAIFDDESKRGKWVPKIQMHILAGAEIRAGERMIYPIIKVFVIAAEDRLLGLRISPIALLIVEPGMQYALSLEGKKMNVEEIYKLDASLKDIAAAASLEPSRDGAGRLDIGKNRGRQDLLQPD